MPSANTFGTFLSTLEELQRDKNNSSAGDAADAIVRIVQTLSPKGEVSLRSIVESLNIGRGEALQAVLQGQRDGLIALQERNGESMASLTPMGRAFVD